MTLEQIVTAMILSGFDLKDLLTNKINSKGEAH